MLSHQALHKSHAFGMVFVRLRCSLWNVKYIRIDSWLQFYAILQNQNPTNLRNFHKSPKSTCSRSFDTFHVSYILGPNIHWKTIEIQLCRWRILNSWTISSKQKVAARLETPLFIGWPWTCCDNWQKTETDGDMLKHESRDSWTEPTVVLVCSCGFSVANGFGGRWQQFFQWIWRINIHDW